LSPVETDDMADPAEQTRAGANKMKDKPNNDFKCDLCGSRGFKTLYDKAENNGTILKCLSCGFIFIYPQSRDEKELTSYYQESSAINDNDLARLNKKINRLNLPIRKIMLKEFYGYRNISPSPDGGLDKILAFLLMPFFGKDIIPFQGQGKILDIGCGSGLSLVLLKSIGWDVYGVEVNTFACDYASKMGIKMFCGKLEDADFAPGYFDVIKITHVIEHVPSPDRIFAEMKRILKPGGKIYLETPNVRSFAAGCFKENWLGMGGHISGFSAQTLSFIGKKHGFSVKKTRFKSGKGTVLDALNYFWKNTAKRPLPDFILKNKVFQALIVKPLCVLLNLLRKGDAVSVVFILD